MRADLATLLALLLTAGGCSVLSPLMHSSPPVDEPPATRTARLERELAANAGGPEGARIALDLGLALVDPENPRRDLAEARKAFDRCLDLADGSRDASETAAARSWIAMLDELETLRGDLASVRKRLNRLQTAKTKAEKTLEQLETLDLELEEKRRQLR